jgi:hypothetical protein
MNNDERQEGEIIFWNRKFGFIKIFNSDKCYYFNKKSLGNQYADVNLLDKVSFNIEEVREGVHIGKFNAAQLAFIEKGDFSEHQRTIGRMINWNGRYGFLESPQLDREVILFSTRLIKTKKKLNSGDYLILSPVKSSKNKDQLFAFFAYPLEDERDIAFLQEQKKLYQNNPVRETIINIVRSLDDRPVDIKFKTELAELVNTLKENLFPSLKILIKQYKEEYKFTPSFSLLKEYLTDFYLVQLWEYGIIKGYDLETMITYFCNSSADTKRAIINRFPLVDKLKILKYYFEHFIKNKISKKANNELKTFLGIVYRNQDTREIEIYKEAKQHIFSRLYPQELISLWIRGYIEDLPEKFVVDNFNFDDIKSIYERGTNYAGIIKKILENYLLSFHGQTNFDVEYPKLIKYLNIYKEIFNTDFEKILKASFVQLENYQKFILWIFEPTFPFDGHSFFEDNWSDLDLYFLLKYLIKEDVDFKADIINIANSITEDKIIEYVEINPWNEVIKPVNQDNQNEFFIKDVMAFTHKFKRNDISVKTICEIIYDAIPYYSVDHLRLWLYSYVKDNRFSYVGYRGKFKELTFDEMKLFRDRGDSKILAEIVEGEMQEVEPCLNYIQKGKDITIYKAHVENIYFMKGSLKLRRENSIYTNVYYEEFSSTGLNRIPKSSEYSTIQFTITVVKNDIKEIDGLDEFFSMIQSGLIQKALVVVGANHPSDHENKESSYVEDWNLRKNILSYLEEQQFSNYAPTIVNEPKKYYNSRRSDKNPLVDFSEKTILYTIQTPDGFGIVWENIDFTEDRSTYIFKATNETYLSQIKKIADAIVTYYHLRSTLISASEDENLDVFRHNLGFIAKINKQRGKNLSFDNWKGKLQNHLLRPIHKVPEIEQIQILQFWLNKTSEGPEGKAPGKIINIRTLPDDIFNPPPSQVDTQTKASAISLGVKFEILNQLKAINQLLQN